VIGDLKGSGIDDLGNVNLGVTDAPLGSQDRPMPVALRSSGRQIARLPDAGRRGHT
jgi:hypothetical protein